MKTVCVLGAGAWGTAVATLLAENGCMVNLWCHEPAVMHDITTSGVNNRYMPGFTLSEAIHPTTSLEHALQGAHIVFEAIPVKFLRSVLGQAQPYYTSEQIWVTLSKGIEQETFMVPTQLVNAVFGASVAQVVVAGPSFARDLVHKQYTAVCAAGTSHADVMRVKQFLSNKYVAVQVTDDMVGMQLCAALKNVIALGIGILDGAGFTDNTKAFFLTKSLHEMAQLSSALGGKSATAYGLSGVGDLVLTAMGGLSRNLAVGKELGKGKQLDVVLRETGYIPEGITTVQSLQQLMHKQHISLPLCRGIYHIIFENRSVSAVLDELMQQTQCAAE